MHLGGGGADLVEDACAFGDVEGHSAQVDGVAAIAGDGCFFDDGGVDAVVVEPVGEGRSRDTGAGDEDGAYCGHVLFSLGLSFDLFEVSR